MAVPTPLRAALLAAWGTAFLQGVSVVDEAVAEVEGADEPHLVVTDTIGSPDELAEGLAAMAERGVTGLRLALPAPGDLLGLLGPASFNAAALSAGEAVIAVDASAPGGHSVLALVPNVTTFGTPGDQGHCVTWRTMMAAAGRPDVPTVAEADRELRDVMRASTEALSSFGITSWASDARETASQLRAGTRRVALPSVAGPRAETLLHRSLTVLAISDASRSDTGASLTSFAAEARLSALIPLERAARRGLVAAAGACLETVRH